MTQLTGRRVCWSTCAHPHVIAGQGTAALELLDEAGGLALRRVSRFDKVVFAVLGRATAATTYHTFADIIRAEIATSN